MGVFVFGLFYRKESKSVMNELSQGVIIDERGVS
jgi:hypothetical protein